ncbi:branched-chain amino acid ABC transporter substrate-binding protein [Vineibacter terrae]|uniref:Branched-chain amino acid ABC transporter substrate-binding protein n=1 Tax=Vineibacter terrae TaxID=2586908 RepID=A0A5C8PIV0_9HYPH|nr:ABC transporter substrate-binding protein [Vineibacter terrae]TXL73283.1 branched-chain amino acid ABC transporter substrate-binding protein [Vineibacter terrae]
MSHRLTMLAACALVAMATGASAQTRGVTKTEIVLGSHTDLSGVGSVSGSASVNGMNLRFGAINDQGGINGRKVRLIVEDHGYQVPKAVQACNKLINRDKVFAIVAAGGTPMNNACFKDQLAAGVPNLFPFSAARSMYEPLDRLKFANSASYTDQMRAAVSYFVKEKGKKAVCVMYQDTDFGKEILDGGTLQAAKLGISLKEITTHKPTDQDFSAPLLKLRQAGCDLVLLGSITRDSIVPYTTARKMGWTDVDFVASSAAYEVVAATAQGMDGFYAMSVTNIPYADSASPEIRAFAETYKKKFNVDPNMGAVYGYVAADLTATGLKNAGADLTSDSFIKGMEAIKGYKDIFNGPAISFGPDIRQGANASFLAVVKDGRWSRITPALTY